MRLLVFLIGTVVYAQGIPAEWNVRQQLEDLRTRFAAIPPELEKIDLNNWRARGVEAAYLTQLESILAQLKSLTLAIEDLRQTPEKLSIALEIFLRFDSLDSMQRSVMEAIRKFEAPEIGDTIETRFVESAPSRTRFRNYLLDLAALRDSENEVLLKEAQRCRVEKNSPATPPAKKK